MSIYYSFLVWIIWNIFCLYDLFVSLWDRFITATVDTFNQNYDENDSKDLYEDSYELILPDFMCTIPMITRNKIIDVYHSHDYDKKTALLFLKMSEKIANVPFIPATLIQTLICKSIYLIVVLNINIYLT